MAALAVLGVLLAPLLLLGAVVLLAVGTPIAGWLGHDAYRGLGHAIDGDYLVARSGTWCRDTVALRRAGILSWTFSGSPTARRAGVLTLTAAVAAGEHGYRIPDLAADDAVELAQAAAPGILTEFLDPVTPALAGAHIR